MGISFITGKAAEIDCDGIINPCDEKLSGCIGIDLQIHRAGGKWLSMHCKEFAPLVPGRRC